MSNLDNLTEEARHEILRQKLEELESLRHLYAIQASLDSPADFMRLGTKTVDEQASGKDALKPFPDWFYLSVVLACLDQMPRFALWKSRTMMGSWIVALWTVWKMFTNPFTRVVFQSEDERRALNMVQYQKWLWENALPELRAKWQLDRPLDAQPQHSFELHNGSSSVALPGGITKLKSEHPTLYVVDEAATALSLNEYLASAEGAKTPQIILISSAWPGQMADMYDATTHVPFTSSILAHQFVRDWVARNTPQPYPDSKTRLWAQDGTLNPLPPDGVTSPFPGLGLRSKVGLVDRKPIKNGYMFLDLFVTAKPEITATDIADIRARFPTEAHFRREVMGDARALQGSRVYPAFDRSVHVCSPQDIPSNLTIYMSCDPHPRTPHAFLWLGVDQWGDYWVFREYWPSPSYGNITSHDHGTHIPTIRDYVQALGFMEGFDVMLSPSGHGGKVKYHPYSERIHTRIMDNAGKGFKAYEGGTLLNMSTAYHDYGLRFADPYKAHDVGEEAVRTALTPRPHSGGKSGTKPQLMISSDCVELISQAESFRYPDPKQGKDDAQDPIEVRCHSLDNLRYIIVAAPRYVSHMASHWYQRHEWGKGLILNKRPLT